MKLLGPVLILQIALSHNCWADQCDQLSEFIKTNQISSVDTLLKEMKKAPEWSDYLERYTLMFKSKSLQPASAKKPRAIIYGPDAKMIMTFAGSPDSKGRDAIELSCWREKKDAFEFFELTSNGKTLIGLDPSGVNPTRCTLCHGQDPRPNWESYNFWSGAFGGRAREGCSIIRRNSQEDRNHQLFMKHSFGKGRYAVLPQHKATESSRYAKSCPEDKDVYTFANAASTEPNAEMQDLLTPLNSRRIARIIKSAPQSERFFPLIKGLQAECPKIENFIPSQWLASRKTYDEVAALVRATYEFEFNRRIRKFKAVNDTQSNFEPQLSAYNPKKFFMSIPDSVELGFAYLFEMMGLESSRLSFGFDSGTYDMTSNLYYTRKIFFAAASEITGTKYINEKCDSLKTQSLEALTGYTGSQVSPTIPASPKVEKASLSEVESSHALRLLQDTCLKCHGIEEVNLPFDGESQIKQAFRESRDLLQKITNRILGIGLKEGESQMPLKSGLDADTQVLLVEYLQSLGDDSSR